jgi:hypothetical protein
MQSRPGMLALMGRDSLCWIALLAGLVFLAFPLPADDVSVGLEAGGGYTTEGTAWAGFYDLGRVDLGFSSEFLDLGFAFHVTNDGKYDFTDFWMEDIGNQYFMLDEGYTRLRAGRLLFEGGFLRALSSLDTPYDVFLNANGHSSPGMLLAYKGSRFEYESRWIGVNIRSQYTYGYGDAAKAAEYWRDKGVNYRMIAVHLGDWRIGYQESTVYLDRVFDPLYFLSPMPSILSNTILTQGHNPWVAQGNDNSLMGLFAEYRSGPAYAVAQLLIDDINLNFLLPEGSPLASSTNLTKLAWSLGGTYRLAGGTVGFWHGGATAHTYAAVYPGYDPSIDYPYDANTLPYEYTWYPVSVWEGHAIDLRDSSIGFPWGENALAFRLTYDTEILQRYPWGFGFLASLEYVINGSKSPDNPWHEYTRHSDIPQRIQLFNVGGDEVLEHRITLHVGATKELGDFELKLAFDVGGVINGLEPYVWPVGSNWDLRNEPLMLRPVKGNNRFLFVVHFGARYRFRQALR